MKKFFLARSARERGLLLLFLLAATIVWLSSAADRLGRQWREHRVLAIDTAGQKLWLGSRAEIDGRAQRAAATLDPARTLDATRLVGEVSAFASRAGLSPAVEPPRTQRSAPFAYHTVQVGFRRASLGALVKFYRELGERAPYVALEECTLSASRANPAELDAQFTIFSVEVPR